MGTLKRLLRSRPAQEAFGRLVARYLQLVRRANRFVVEAADGAALEGEASYILATWHGQHIMLSAIWRSRHRVVCLISRSGDGEINAIAVRHLGMGAIRGSGARGRNVREKGGAPALRGMIRALQENDIVALTADVPKIARRCGEGIVALARLSGRPIVPAAAATSRRLDFGSWDRASLGLPFGRGALVIGAPIHVPREADAAALERARQAVEAELDRVHARAFALIGGTDPGAGLHRIGPAGRDAGAAIAEAGGSGA